MVFGWFHSEKWAKRRKVRLDRKHLEATRRFLRSYLAADEARKPHSTGRSKRRLSSARPAEFVLSPSELEDAQIAEATSAAGLQMVLAREKRAAQKEDDCIADFVTDACATVGIAYHRAAGVYTNKEMQELGTAAVHLLTMATSYMRVHKK